MSMFLVYSAAGHSDPPHLPQETNIEQCLELLDSNADFPTHRSVQLALPVANLRSRWQPDSEWRILFSVARTQDEITFSARQSDEQFTF